VRRPWPTSARIAVSVAAVTILFLPIADYKWSLLPVRPYDPVTGANPIYVSAPVGDVSAPITQYTWRVSTAFSDSVVAALAGIGMFLLLGRVVGATAPRETLCRRCGHILRELREPECPACGEHL